MSKKKIFWANYYSLLDTSSGASISARDMLLELNKLGFSVEVDEDDFLINKIGSVRSEFTQSVNTYDDHRMAMAFTPLALLGKVTIEDKNVVAKSYPNFWEDIEVVGFEVF